MANVFTDYAFLHNNLNLNRLDLGAYDAYFYDDANIEFNSINYKDVYEIYWTYGDSYNVSAFAGPSLNVSSGIVTGGTVTGYLEGYWDGSVWQYTWGLQNISIDGAALIAAVKTTETEDDYIIFDAVLTGADIFDLSNANDFAYGLAGDDTLNGYGGGDTLHGDAGDDTLNGGDGDDILYGGRGTDTVNGGDGNDILDGGSGDDVLIGGAGNDTYSLPTIDSADVAIIEDGSGYLISSSYGRDSLASVEQITLSDGTFEISDLATKLTTTASPGYRYFELTGDDLVDAMTHGHSWDLGPDRTIDFAIANGFNGEYWFDPSDVTSHLDSALQLISKYTDVKFNNLGFFADPAIAYEYGAEITLSLDGSAKFFQDPKYLGRAFFPSNNEDVSAGYVGAGGDLYLNIDSKANSYTSYEPGSQGWFLLLHELGHVLGLKHPHDDGGTGRPTFEELNRGELNDDTTTVMSYEDTTESLNEVSYDPATPMILDVLALQYLYGKNTSTNSGDTTFDLAANEGYYLTHWDADGDDLIDATNTSSGWQIVLPTVTGSALIDTQVGWAYSLSPNGTVNDETRVWLAGEIENATGSRFDDALTGNTLDNSLHGGAGNDTIDGGAGDDVLIGGAGDDTIILESNGTFGSDLFAYNTTSSVQAGTEESINLDGKTRFGDVMDGGANVDTVELTDSSDAFFLHDSFSGFHSSLTLVEDYDSRLGTARIANIENINSGLGDDIVDLTSPDYSLVGQNITVDGGSGDDTLWGSDANETLKGGVGDDELFGGAGTNVLTGGAGADEFQFTKTSIADTVTDYDLTSGDQLNFFYETGSEEADWSFSILNGDLRWGANTIDFGAMEVTTLGELSIFVEEIGSGQASQLEYVPTLGEEILRLDLYPALYEQDYYGKIVTDLKFTELDDLATTIDIDMTFLGELNEVAMATGIEANGNGFIYSAGAVFNNTYNTVEIVADISNFKIDGIAANPISLQALLEATTIAPDKVGGLFNSITLSANSVDYLTLNHTANGLSLIYDNATNGMINELRLDGSFTNDLNKVIPVVSDLLNFDFSDPIALLGSQEFLDTSAYLDSSATLSGLSILQKGVANPYLQLTATDTTLNVAYKDWDIVGAIEVSETWQADPDAVLSTLQNLVTSTNELDLSELGSLYEGAGSLSLAIMHDQTGKLAEGVIHDFGDLIGSLDREAGDEFIFGKATGGSYAIDSNGLAAVVFKERELNEIQITELLDELDIRLEGEGGSSSTTTVSAAALAITLEGAGLQSDYLGNDILIIG